MANREYDFFARRAEALDILLPVVDLLGLVVLTDGGGLELPRVVSPQSMRTLDASKPARFWVSRSVPPREVLESTHSAPGKWGWVSLHLPQERGNELLMGYLGAKNVWHEDGVRKTNPESFDLFSRLTKELKRHARGPVRVRNVATGASAPARNVGVMDGARDWVANHGQLRDSIARNIAYEVAGSA